MVRQPIEQGGGHLCVDKHAGPLAERQIRCDQHAGVLVELGQQMEQQGGTRLAEGQIPQFIKDDQIHAQQACRNPPGLTLRLLLLQRVDQIDGGILIQPCNVSIFQALVAETRAGQSSNFIGPEQ